MVMVIVNKKYKLFLIAVIITFIDMLSKILVKRFLLLGERHDIITNIFYLTYVKNTGAAFSILNNNTLFLIMITMIILIVLIYYLMHHELKKFEIIGYGLILGGAFGNLFDRVFYGYVIDFIDVYIFGYDYPVFNLADIAIVIGVILLVIQMFRGDKSEFKSTKRNKN